MSFNSQFNLAYRIMRVKFLSEPTASHSPLAALGVYGNSSSRSTPALRRLMMAYQLQMNAKVAILASANNNAESYSPSGCPVLAQNKLRSGPAVQASCLQDPDFN